MPPLTPPPAHYPAEHFFNRELSLLQFQRRVLAMAESPGVPLIERLRYLCIVSSNLDEFFEIRVAGLKEQLRQGITRTGIDGLPIDELLERIGHEVHALVARQYALWNETLIPALAREGIVFVRRTHWSDAQREWLTRYFVEQIEPLLTPIALDPAHPFPRILNKSLNFAVELEGKDAFGRTSGRAIVQAPRALPRVLRLPKGLSEHPYAFVFLSSIIHANVHRLFPGMHVKGCYQFRVTRNSDLFLDEEEIKDLRDALSGELRQRHFGDAVRLEVADNCSEQMARFLLEQFQLSESALYRVPGIVNLVRLMAVCDEVDRPDLKYPPFTPRIPKTLLRPQNTFAVLNRQDQLLHHPYESFDPVVNLLRTAADDPAVVAVKMTVYRTGTDSVLMEQLIRAAQAGKEVTVVMELMARFDEEANIRWARRLHDAGAHVVYGVFGYKTHAKLLLIIRREDGGLKRYCHIGTGNYHPRTARLYTDFGLLTAHPEICADVDAIFRSITGMGDAPQLKYLWQSPFTLHPQLLAHIEAEAETARAGGKGRIIAKMNALLEPHLIEALYAASQAGVEIDLIVRGPCALKPGVPGLSEQIRVRSIVGRFLEHHRIFYFHAKGERKVYLSSADWMDRNCFRRVEVACPVLDPALKRRVIAEGLRLYLLDNAQAWELGADGRYRLKHARQRRRAAQEILLQELARSSA